MSDVSGIPNLGIPGISGFNGGGGVNGIPGSNGLASAQDQYYLNQRFFADQAAAQAAAVVPQSQLYGGGSFGAQPAHYAGVGAAYGRAVSPSSQAAVAAEHGSPAPPTQVPVESSIFDTAGTGPVPYARESSRYFGAEPAPPFTPALPSMGYTNPPPSRGFDSPGITGVPYSPSSGPASFVDLQPPPPRGFMQTPEFSTSQPQSGIFDGVGGPRGGIRTAGPAYPADVNSTPNPEDIYAGFPHTEAGSTRAGHNAGSANPFTSGADPIGNLGSPFAAGRGFEATPPSPFDVGAPHIGPTMGPFMSATPGGGVGRGQPPPSYAPSSPFEGGASPVPFPKSGGQAFPVPGIGGYRGSMRDQIAAIMSGSHGMVEPSKGGTPIDNGAIGTEISGSMPLPQPRPQGANVPSPSPSQMGAAHDVIRSQGGRGSFGATPVPPPPAPYAKINNAIFDAGNASRPGMFDNLSQPLGSMFSPGQYRGAPQPSQPAPTSPPFNTKAGPISQSDIDQAWQLQGVGGRFLR